MSILDTEMVHQRQFPQAVVQPFDYTDLTSATAIAAAKLPYNARVIGGGVVVETAWDSGTSDVLDVGDGGDDDRYTASQIDLTALGYTALDITGYKYTVTDTIDLTWTGVGTAPSAGQAQLILMYVIDGNGNAGVMPSYD